LLKNINDDGDDREQQRKANGAPMDTRRLFAQRRRGAFVRDLFLARIEIARAARRERDSGAFAPLEQTQSREPKRNEQQK
jgi:hypothetical protein